MSCLRAMRHRQGRHQAGFSLVAAIFILVVLALLGTFMVTINSVQTTVVAQTLQAARAYQAARVGIEWGVMRALSPIPATVAATCGTIPPPNPTIAVTSSFPLSGAGFDGFNVSVTCNYTRHQETSNCFNVFRITSLATSGTYGDPYYVSREVEAKVTDAPGSGCP
jgi:MSHA biogenesis protein MshP